MERFSKLGFLKAKPETKNQAGMDRSHRLPSAGAWLYLQNEHYVYLQGCYRVQPNTVSYRQIIGAHWAPVAIITEAIWLDEAS